MERDTDQKILTTSLMILTGIALTGVLIYTRPILLPFTVAVFVFIATLPLVNYLTLRWRFPYSLSLISTAIVLLLSFGLLLAIVSSSFRELGSSMTLYRENLAGFVNTLAGLFEPYGLQIGAKELQAALQELPVLLYARNITENLVSFLANFLLVTIFVIFLFLGDNRNEERHPVFQEISLQISRYLVIKFLTSLVTGILVGTTLTVIGVDLAFLFGVLAFTLNFIPNIGSIVATALPIPIAVLQFRFGLETLLVLLIPGAVQFVVGNIMEPKLMGSSMDLHPVTVLFFLVFWGLVWGIPGMFLSVPIMSTLKIIFNKFERTQRLSELLAGRGIFQGMT